MSEQFRIEAAFSPGWTTQPAQSLRLLLYQRTRILGDGLRGGAQPPGDSAASGSRAGIASRNSRYWPGPANCSARWSTCTSRSARAAPRYQAEQHQSHPRGTVKLVDFGLVKVMQPDDTRTVTVVQGGAAPSPTRPWSSTAAMPATPTCAATSTVSAPPSTTFSPGSPPADAKQRFLQPGSLTSLRQLNATVTTRCERAIFQALAMHPSERPPTVRAFRELLLGTRRCRLPSSPRAAADRGRLGRVVPAERRARPSRRWSCLLAIAVFLNL